MPDFSVEPEKGLLGIVAPLEFVLTPETEEEYWTCLPVSVLTRPDEPLPGQCALGSNFQKHFARFPFTQ